jgi:hypothetical protein
MKMAHRMSMWRYAHAGEMLPRGYGIAWVDFYSNRAVCLPVPLHIIASIVRTVWQKVRTWRAPDLLRAEYDRGHGDGYAAGFKSGTAHRDPSHALEAAMQHLVPLLAFSLDRVVSYEEFAADPHKYIGHPKASS